MADPITMTFEIDQGQLFDAVREARGDASAIGTRIVGVMLMGKASFTDEIGMAAYGITIPDEGRDE